MDMCAWSSLFDNDGRESLENGFIITGFISVLLGLWQNLSVLCTKLGSDWSYRNLTNFTMIACIRRIVTLFINQPLFQFVESSGEIDLARCQFFAFLDTFMSVLEVEALTHVCIERYVVAKYMFNEWPIQKWHYTLYQWLCLFFATLYSFPPIFGIGRYGFDLTCSTCTFDMLLPASWDRYFVVVIFMLRGLKPIIFMLAMLTWARTLEDKLSCSKETEKQKKITQSVIMITLVNQFCWSPAALIRGSVIVSQLLYSDPIELDSELYVKWAMWIHWMSPALTAVTLLTTDCNVRDKMLHFRSRFNFIQDNGDKQE